MPACASSTHVDREMSDRIFSARLKQWKFVEWFTGVSGGPSVHGALEGRLINVLITDFGTASDLLAQAH
jgi:DNA-binding transcriptional regulator LsrR (DeoR family)